MKRIGFGLAALAIGLSAGCESAGELLVAGTMSGDWTGEAHCGLGARFGMKLTLDYMPGGATTGTMVLSGKGDGGKDVEMAAYNLSGTYDAATYKLSLQPTGWIRPPAIAGAPMIPVETELQPSTRTMAVTITDNCQAFELSRS